jgi:hypothetical protein
MRVSVVIDDNMVAVGGVGFHVDCSWIDQAIHAIQWYDTHGEIEYRSTYLPSEGRWDRRPNLQFNDFSPYERLIPEWNERKAEFDAQVQAEKARDAEFEQVKLETERRNQEFAKQLEAARNNPNQIIGTLVPPPEGSSNE